MRTILTHRRTKAAVLALCLVPLAVLLYRWQTNQLGINRGEAVARFTGSCTIRLVLLTLCVTPLRRIPGLQDLIGFRRMLGLFAYFYGCLHFLHYLWIDKAWNGAIIWEDLVFRRFYLFGWIALAAMTPLALTSTPAAVRRLGGRSWQRLHRFVYLTAAAGIFHFYLQDKFPDPLAVTYAQILGVLLGWRVLWWASKKATRRASQSSGSPT